MTKPGEIDYQYLDMPGNHYAVRLAHGRGAEHLGEQLAVDLSEFAAETGVDVSHITDQLSYGNIAGATVELGRLRDHLARELFGPGTPAPAVAMEAATNLIKHAEALIRTPGVDPRRLHSFLGPLRVGAREMTSALAAADPADDDTALLAVTFSNLSAITLGYLRRLRAESLGVGASPAVMSNLRNALNALADASGSNERRETQRLAVGVAQQAAATAPRHSPKDQLAQNERFHGQAHADRTVLARRQLSEILVKADSPEIDPIALADAIATAHNDPLAAVPLVASFSNAVTPERTFTEVVRTLITTRISRERRYALAAELETAKVVMDAIWDLRRRRRSGAAEGYGESLSTIYAGEVPEYAIPHRQFVAEVTQYRDEFFRELGDATGSLDGVNAVVDGVIDPWSRIVERDSFTTYVQSMSQRLAILEVGAQQLAGAHLRIARPGGDEQDQPGWVFSAIASDIAAKRDQVSALVSRWEQLADAVDEGDKAAVVGILSDFRASPQWVRRLGGDTTAYSRSQLAHNSAALLEPLRRRDGKIVDGYRLARYFGRVAEARFTAFPAKARSDDERRTLSWHRGIRTQLARDGANMMLHAGGLHPAAVMATAVHISTLVNDVRDMLLASIQSSEAGEKIPEAFDDVYQHVDVVLELDNPTSSQWRKRFEQLLEQSITLSFPPHTLPYGVRRVKPMTAEPEGDNPSLADGANSSAPRAPRASDKMVYNPPDPRTVHDQNLPIWLRGLPAEMVYPDGQRPA